jgi:acylphosphatase
VYGRVQGVYFRGGTLECAESLGVNGWVANRSDGSVEGVAEGERGKLEQFKEFLEQGPRQARVQELTLLSREPEGMTSFVIRR